MLVLKDEHPELYEHVQAQNLNRQYGLLTDCIRIGLRTGPAAFDKYFLWALNHVAVASLSQFGGRFRREPVYVGDHRPPDFSEIDNCIDRFIAIAQENWRTWAPTELAAYGLWRLNWIHPFNDGNGRTARAVCYYLLAVCYYLLSVRMGHILPGKKAIPERIRENRNGYVAALRAADRAWDNGELDFTEMEQYLADLLEAQLREVD